MSQSLRTTLACLVMTLAAFQNARGETPLEYNRDIRPILADKCFACHGPDSAARKADLRLDQRDAAIEMSAITPEEPDESEMIRRILSDDADEVMPPPESKKTVTAEERRVLSRWIREGAQYELHWSFIPPTRGKLPDVPESLEPKFADWPRNEIDRFILARLAVEGLEPASEAARHTLVRRVSLDLTGLPPTPQIVEAFLQDKSPDAYERLVDKLLESSNWGEHRARYWLDYARYADTHGVHFDNYREMWSYRDWVISAFNRNLPWDQFTVESLAGDLLPDATLDQKIGSGFNRCNMTTNEGGIIDEEYLVLYTRDRTETTAQLWLGLTAGCAVCHSHKFDPLSQHEFYELAAFFNNTTQRARDGNVKDTPPIVVAPQRKDRSRWIALPKLIEEARQNKAKQRSESRAEFQSWLGDATPEAIEESSPSKGLYLRARLNEGQGQSTSVEVKGTKHEVALAESASWTSDEHNGALEVQGEVCAMPEAGDFESQQPRTCAAWVRMPASDGFGAICARMDDANAYRGWDFWSQRRQIGMHIVHDWPDNGLKVVAKDQIAANQWVHVAVTYDGSSKAAGVKVYYNGQPQATNVETDKLSASSKTGVPFKIGQRNTGQPFTGRLRDLRIYDRALTPGEVAALAKSTLLAGLIAKSESQRTEADTMELFNFWLETFHAPYQSAARQLVQLESERDAIKARGTIAHVMHETNEPATAHVLYRGEYDERRDEVSADTPDVLPPFPESLPRNRLGFARWLLLPDHPLTARVTVNRFWQEVFGTGIVRTAGDFGVMGELPSHPELLDWLAVDFRESGWDVKQLFKTIVMSATYRQSAAADPNKIERDPANRLLARGPRFRMDAEMVRDYALAASGLLKKKVGGPSVKPYQPPGVWESIAMNVSNTRKYEQSVGDDLYRRSLYTFWKRQAPPASMDIFNAPAREYCVVSRERTNTPLQALVTLNDPQFVEAARHLAGFALKDGGDTLTGRAGVVGRRLLARDFSQAEIAVIEDSLAKLRAYYENNPEDAARLLNVGESPPDASLDPAMLAAWTMLANQLLNLDEVLNK